jgi:hypothetical protein
MRTRGIAAIFIGCSLIAGVVGYLYLAVSKLSDMKFRCREIGAVYIGKELCAKADGSVWVVP